MNTARDTEWQHMSRVFTTIILALAVILPAAGPAYAQSKGGGKMYCCAHCAKHEGVKGVNDRAA